MLGNKCKKNEKSGNQHFETLSEIADLSKDHQWIFKTIGYKFVEEQDICMGSKYPLKGYLLIMKGKEYLYNRKIW